MDDVRKIWSWWQALLAEFASVFTRPGWVRFAQWVTGTVLCWEQHTITQILTALALESRWRVLENFAEYGAWDRAAQFIRVVSDDVVVGDADVQIGLALRGGSDGQIRLAKVRNIVGGHLSDLSDRSQ